MKSWFAIALVFASSGAAAASFDCAEATTTVEKSICADRELSGLDDSLASTYKVAQQDAVNADLIRVRQRDWLTKERNVCKNPACIRAAYTKRIAELAARNAIAAALGGALAEWAKPDPLPAYRYGLHDLNDDGMPDAIVLLTGDYCGSGGCMMVILQRTPQGFRYVSHSTLTRAPIVVLGEKRNGWYSLAVSVAGGGTDPGQAMLRFDGTAYPLNPSVQPYLPSPAAVSMHTLDLQ